MAGLVAVGIGYWTVQEAKAAEQSSRLYQRLRALQEVAQARIGMDIALTGGLGADYAGHKGKLLVALAAFEPMELPACRALGDWKGAIDEFPPFRDAATTENEAAFVDTRARLAAASGSSWLRRLLGGRG